MTGIVVPFRGSGAKLRLNGLGDDVRQRLARAMLGDVLAACTAVARTLLVTDDEEVRALAGGLGAEALADPGDGQGVAVAAGLARLHSAPFLVVNADLPCVVPHDLRVLAAAVPAGGLALVAARDGTTNALALASAALFEPLYGPGSADRFRRRAAALGAAAVTVATPNLVDDVDAADDLSRVAPRAGPRTQSVLHSLGIAA